nr:MAG TPA: hypothetical protein [Caudoviricetes sp.]
MTSCGRAYLPLFSCLKVLATCVSYVLATC